MSFSVFLLSFVIVTTVCAAQDVVKKRPCNIAYKCSLVEQPVWITTDNKSCEVFRNGCILASTNCSRRNQYKPEARDIGQEKCQKLCKTSCVTTNATLVCGYYNQEMRNFGSQCQMDSVNCSTGKTFSLYAEGMCPV